MNNLTDKEINDLSEKLANKVVTKIVISGCAAYLGWVAGTIIAKKIKG